MCFVTAGVSVSSGVTVQVSASSVVFTTTDKFPANTEITIAGESGTYHTSCSVPVYVGQVLRYASGDLKLTSFVTNLFDDSICAAFTTAPKCVADVADCPKCNVCGTLGAGRIGKGTKSNKGKVRITTITMEYVGGNATASNMQDGKASVTGSAVSNATAYISCTGADTATVALGGTFSVPISGANTMCSINNGTQSITAHTSCSKSLAVGDRFGALVVASFGLDSGLTLSDVCPACNVCTPTTIGMPTTAAAVISPTTTPSCTTTCPVCNGCSAPKSVSSWGKGSKNKAKLMSVTVQYTGGNVIATNLQEGKASVTGQAIFSDQATVTCDGAEPVELRMGIASVTIAVSGADTTCTIFAPGTATGSGAQTITFHTSCSMSLNVGDRFGALTVQSFIQTSGLTTSDVCPCNVCSTPDKRVDITTTTKTTPEQCTDNNVNCSSWAETGECTKNPTYMSPECCASCAITTTTTTTPTATTTTATTTTATTTTGCTHDCPVCLCVPDIGASDDVTDNKMIFDPQGVARDQYMTECSKYVAALNDKFRFKEQGAANLVCLEDAQESDQVRITAEGTPGTCQCKDCPANHPETGDIDTTRGKCKFYSKDSSIAGETWNRHNGTCYNRDPNATTHECSTAPELHPNNAPIPGTSWKTTDCCDDYPEAAMQQTATIIMAYMKSPEVYTREEVFVNFAKDVLKFAPAEVNRRYLQTRNLYSCRITCLNFNRIKKETYSEDLCSATEQARFQDRSCFDPLGVDERDCSLSTADYSGMGPRPSLIWSNHNWGVPVQPSVSSYPEDQTFVKRPFVEQNSPDYIRKELLLKVNASGQDVRGWFNWRLANPDNYDGGEYAERYKKFFDIPQYGYEECEGDPDCEVFAQQTDVKLGITQLTNPLQDWDVKCFGALADRCLPHSNGTVEYFKDAKLARENCRRPTAYNEGGQSYLRACRIGSENLLLKCLPPKGSAATGVKTVCGCSDLSSKYVRDGLADLCYHAETPLPHKYGNLSCSDQNEEEGNFREPETLEQPGNETAAATTTTTTTTHKQGKRRKRVSHKDRTTPQKTVVVGRPSKIGRTDA